MSKMKFDLSKIENGIRSYKNYQSREGAILDQVDRAQGSFIMVNSKAETVLLGEDFSLPSRQYPRRLNCEGKEFALPIGVLLIGRDVNACAIFLNDHTVSRMHAILTVHENGQVTIRDLQSGNGTRVNGSRISEFRLQIGDRVQIGESEFVFG